MKSTLLKSDQEHHPVGDLWSTDHSLPAAEAGTGFLGVSSLGIALAIFLIDRMIHDFIPVSGLYVVVLYLTTRLDWPRYFWIGMGGCSGLIILDLLLGLPGQNPALLCGIAGVGAMILWAVGWVLWTQTNEMILAKEREQELLERLQDLTRELGLARIKVEANLLKRQESEHALAALNDALSEQNRELETILSVASHDLRSPLVNVQGFGKELAKACASLQRVFQKEGLNPPGVTTIIEEDIPEALHYIQAGAEKMETLLQGVFRLARLGRLTLRHEQLDMNAMIAGIIAGMEYQLKENDVAIRICDLPPCFGDPTLITQLFCNLLDNAHKYLEPSRKGLINLSGTRDGEWVRYIVKDNGKGISDEQQDKIFQMFHRLYPSESRGDGLGLTIVKRIVDRHQGMIKVESFPGAGAAFVISLPAG